MKVENNFIYDDDNKIIDRLKNTVVDASAGTGKTFNICEKVIRRLKLGYDIKEFVIMTYTEKAAGELIDRIRGRIETELKNKKITKEERENLLEALNDFDFATICTIHSFCQKILQEYAFECDLPNDFSVDDSSCHDNTAFYISCIKNYQSDFFDIEPNKVLEYFKYFDNYNKIFRNNYDKFYNDVLINNYEFEIKDYIENIDENIKDFYKKEFDIINEIVNCYKLNIEVNVDLRIFDRDFNKEFNNKFGFAISKIKKNKYYYLLENELCDSFNIVKPKIQEFYDLYDKFDKNLYDLFMNINYADYEIVLKPIKNKINEYKISYNKQIIIKEYIYNYIKIKNNNSAFDFNDLITIVSNSLSKNPKLVEELQKKWTVGIIDEFQDTTPLQYNIAQKIFLDRIVVEKDLPSHLIIVGDEKQSIYSFQGANIETYKQAKLNILGFEIFNMNNLSYKIYYPNNYNGYYEELNDNYRTEENLLKIMNDIFTENQIISNYKGVNPKIKYVVNGPQLYIHKLKISESSSIKDLNSAKQYYAQIIANEILKNVKEEKYNDFCILFRASTDAVFITKELNKRNIPFSYYKKDDLFSSFEGQEILLLLKALAYPSEKSYLKSLFATDFFEDYTINDINENENYYIYIENYLEKWREIFANRGIYYMFNEIFNDTHIFERLLIDTNKYDDSLYEKTSNERNITNLSHIVKKLNELKPLNSLSDYYEELKILQENLNKQNSLEEIDSEKNTVKIMTMHASKGLEYKNVFIFGGWYYFNSDGVPYKIIKEKNKEFYFTDTDSNIYEIYKQQNLEEYKRLLYVAITRAKEKLFLPYIFNSVENNEFISNSNNLVLSQGIEHILKSNTNEKIEIIECDPTVYKYSTTTEILDKTKKYDIDDIINDKENILNSVGLDESDNIRNKPVFNENYHDKKREIHSFSSLKNADINKANKFGLDLDVKKDILLENTKGEFVSEQDIEDPLLGGKEIGNIIHEILEKIDFSKFKHYKNNEDLLNDEIIKEYINNYTFLNEKKEQLCKIIYNTLNSILPDLNIKIYEISKYYKEKNFNMALKNPNEVFYLNGTIDLVFKHNDEIYILDWKTNKTKTGTYNDNDISTLMEEHYTNQYKIYVEAVNRWLKDNNINKKVSGIFYVFLRPTESNKEAKIYYKNLK